MFLDFFFLLFGKVACCNFFFKASSCWLCFCFSSFIGFVVVFHSLLPIFTSLWVVWHFLTAVSQSVKVAAQVQVEAQSTKQKLHERRRCCCCCCSLSTAQPQPLGDFSCFSSLLAARSSSVYTFLSHSLWSCLDCCLFQVLLLYLLLLFAFFFRIFFFYCFVNVFVAVASWLTSDNILLAYRCTLRLVVVVIVLLLLLLLCFGCCGCSGIVYRYPRSL